MGFTMPTRYTVLLRHIVLHSFRLAFIALLCCWHSSMLLAQYGFVNTVGVPTGYGSEWGNVYSGTMLQVPQWGTVSTSIPQPQLIPTWQNWQLGAYILNTPYGVSIQQVVPGGVAALAGLKAGDVVISVAGSQVGYVNGRTVDLIYEMNQRADIYGRVRLVVLDSLTRQLRNVDVSINQQQSASVVTGQVFVDGTMLVPANGTLKVELQNITRPYMQVGATSDYRQTFGAGPFPFTIRFDPQYVSPTDRYRLIATFYDANRVAIAYGTQDINAPVPGTQSNYNLRLQGPSYVVSGTANAIGYYPSNTSVLNQAFRQILGRDPSMSEAQAWGNQFAVGSTSVSELKAELLASVAFYDRAGNSPDLFIQRMIEVVTGQPARIDQIRGLRFRLDSYRGMRLPVAREFLASVGQ